MSNKLSHEAAEPLALSVKEVCKLLRLGRTTFYELLKSGKMPAHKCGRRTIVLPSELEEALKSLPRAGAGRAAS
jgi:excisionase family DNA binding protein